MEASRTFYKMIWLRCVMQWSSFRGTGNAFLQHAQAFCPGSGKRLVPRDFNGHENVTLGGIGKRLAGEPGCDLLPLLESGRDSVRDLAAHDMEIFGPAGRLEPERG